MKSHLTVAEAAQVLGTTPKAIRQRIARGQMPFRRWGRRVLISKVELEKFLVALPGKTAEEAVATVEEGRGW